MAGYITRQSTITTGNVIKASDFNDEYNAILGTFSSSSGHRHDGTAGEGARIIATSVQGGQANGILVLNGASTNATASNPFTDGQILLGSTGINPRPISVTGDVTLDNAGVVTTLQAPILVHMGSNGLEGLTADEVTQLLNIDTTTISIGQWGYLGATDQALATTDDVVFNSISGVVAASTLSTTGVATFASASVTAALSVGGTFTSLGIDDNATATRLTLADTGITSGVALISPLGAAATPAYTFAGDLDTGLFSPAADVAGITTGGVERTRFGSYGERLTPIGSIAAPAYSWQNDTDTGMYNPVANALAFSTGGISTLYLTATQAYLNKAQIFSVPLGIHGSYNENGVGGTTDWAGDIWSMGSGFQGSGIDATWAPANKYGLAWVRAGSAEYDSEIGEGLYIYQTGNLIGGLGVNGLKAFDDIVSTATISSVGNIFTDGTMNGKNGVYTGDTADAGGVDSNVFWRDTTSAAWRVIRWDDSVERFSLSMSDGTIHPVAGFHVGVNDTEVDHPVGSYITCEHGIGNIQVNHVIVPRVHATDTGKYDTQGAGTLIPGTWRTCGESDNTSNAVYLCRKVAM